MHGIGHPAVSDIRQYRTSGSIGHPAVSDESARSKNLQIRLLHPFFFFFFFFFACEKPERATRLYRHSLSSVLSIETTLFFCPEVNVYTSSCTTLNENHLLRAQQFSVYSNSLVDQ